jgi:hypothetical protein
MNAPISRSRPPRPGEQPTDREAAQADAVGSGPKPGDAASQKANYERGQAERKKSS